jgi:DHA1 family bicyclomycin/chloramphenicol resistance-like MFS transporter
VLGLLLWRFRETLPQDRRATLQPMALARTWWTILAHPTFQASSALAMASYAGLFTFLAVSPFAFRQALGLSGTEYGLTLFSVSVMYILGTFLCRRLLPRLGLRRTVAVAGLLTLLAGTSMGLLAVAGVRSVWALVLPHWLFMLAHGVHQPCSQSGCVAPFPHAAGAASALNGFLMMVLAFVVGALLGRQSDDAVLTMALGIWFWSGVIAAVAWTLMRRHGELRPA